MRLPKWVVKGIVDEFTLEKAELKIRQQEEEIARLRRQIAELRFNALPNDEKEWVERIYSMMGWPIFWRWRYIFMEEYMKRRDEDVREAYLRKLDEEELPF